MRGRVVLADPLRHWPGADEQRVARAKHVVGELGEAPVQGGDRLGRMSGIREVRLVLEQTLVVASEQRDGRHGRVLEAVLGRARGGVDLLSDGRPEGHELGLDHVAAGSGSRRAAGSSVSSLFKTSWMLGPEGSFTTHPEQRQEVRGQGQPVGVGDVRLVPLALEDLGPVSKHSARPGDEIPDRGRARRCRGRGHRTPPRG